MSTVIQGNIEIPYEIHIVKFSTESDFQNFMEDETRKSYLHLKEKSIKSSIFHTIREILEPDLLIIN